MVYLDTSALVKLYVAEEDGRELVCRVVEKSERIATSTVAYAEARAGLARKQREGIFTAEELRRAVSDLDEDWPTYDRLNVSNPVAYQAGEMAERHALRGYDSVHLASAVRLSERFEDLRFSPSTTASTPSRGVSTWQFTATSPGLDVRGVSNEAE